MTTPVDLGQLHGRLTTHLIDLDQLRQAVADTLALVGGEAREDWNLGQLRELWGAITTYPHAREVLMQLAAFPDRWVAFREIVPDPGLLQQARNELGALRRAIRQQRGEHFPLFERGQTSETGYLQAYRMPGPIAEMIQQLLVEQEDRDA